LSCHISEFEVYLVLSKNLRIKICKNYNFTCFLYGCKSWSLTLNKEYRLRLPELRVLRIFRPKREEVTGGWKALHNEELHNFSYLSDIITIIKSRMV
jgi:hypothetical protein